MRTFSLICAGVALASIAGTAAMWNELRAQRELMAEWQSAHPAPAPGTAAARPAVSGAGSMSPPRVVNPQLRPNPMVPTSNESGQMVVDQDRFNDPAYRETALANLRQIMPHAYPGLVADLALSDAEASRLFDLLAEQQLEMGNLLRPSSDGVQRSAGSAQEVGLRARDLQGGHDLALASMLGDARYAKWQEYQESRRARQQVAQYGGTMSALGQPLSSAQELSLRAVLVAEDRRQRTEMQSLLGSGTRVGALDVNQAVAEARRRRTESNARIVAAAEPHLNAEQLQSLRSSLEQQLAASQVTVRPRQ